MKFSFKTILSLAMSVLLVAAAAPMAKEEPPPPGKIKKLSFPKFKEFTLDNGLEVVVVEHHEQPIASLYLGVRAGSVLDPEGKSSLASFVSSMLNKGTTSKNSDELAKWIESVGGSANVSASDDFTFASVSILSDYLDVAYEYVADIFINPTFPEDELEKERKRMVTALQFQLSDPTSMADRHFRKVVYGHHPYAVQPDVETVEAVTRDDLVAFHGKNFVANNALMLVVGDVNFKNVKKAVEEHFGEWAMGEPEVPDFPEPPERTAKNISLYHRPGSVQTNVYMGHLGISPKNPDWPAVTVANKILGGGATGRLFLNLREEKGWTYGAYSTFTKPVDVGYFRATANVRSEVTDSSVVELLAELERMVKEPVDEKELNDAKSYLTGNFPTTIETPDQIAGQIGQVKLLGLDEKYLEEYRTRIEAVGIPEVQGAMEKYLHPDRMAMVLVGDATEIMEKVEPIAAVALYDIEGAPLDLASLTIEASDYDFDTDLLKDMKATYSVVYQEMNLGDLDISVARNSEEEKFEAVSKIGGMITLDEKLTFATNNFEPISFSMSMQAGPQNLSSSLTFSGGKATGKIEGGKDGPKDVSLDLVGGTIMAGCLDYAIAVLPLETGQSYTFPVIDSQSGNQQSADIEVLGEEELLVAAGSYATFKVRVKLPDGESILYVAKDAPHFMVKREVPAQGLSFELKSVEN